MRHSSDWFEFRPHGVRVARYSNRGRETSKASYPPGAPLLFSAMSQMAFSPRGHDKTLKVARTIADLAGSDAIKPEHLAEAIQYRSLDRQLWV